MLRWVLLFVGVPAVELALLIEIGGRIGTLPTLGLIAATGVIGATLARRQGLSVVRRMQEEVAGGSLPAGPILDGVIILVASAFLLTPGILTDVVGFLGLVPAVRAVVRRWLVERLQRAVQEGRVRVEAFDVGEPRLPTRDITPPRDRDPDA